MSAVMNQHNTPVYQPADRKLVDIICWRMIRLFGVTADEFPHANGWGGRVEQLCLKKAMALNSQTLGRIIVAFPQADLYGVHCGTWLGKYESGPYLLQQLAATALANRISILVGARHEHPVEQYGLADRLPWDD